MNFDHSKAATAVKIIHSHFIKYSCRLLFLSLHITKLFSYFEYHKMLPIWDEDFKFQGEGNIIQWIIMTPAILSITQKMVIGSALGYKNDKLKVSFTKSGLFCYCLFVLIVCALQSALFLESFSLLPVLIISIIKILKRVIVHLPFLISFSKKVSW